MIYLVMIIVIGLYITTPDTQIIFLHIPFFKCFLLLPNYLCSDYTLNIDCEVLVGWGLLLLLLIPLEGAQNKDLDTTSLPEQRLDEVSGTVLV